MLKWKSINFSNQLLFMSAMAHSKRSPWVRYRPYSFDLTLWNDRPDYCHISDCIVNFFFHLSFISNRWESRYVNVKEKSRDFMNFSFAFIFLNWSAKNYMTSNYPLENISISLHIKIELSTFGKLFVLLVLVRIKRVWHFSHIHRFNKLHNNLDS